MDNVSVMIALIESDPDNVVGEKMLIDALVEERDMVPTEAAKHVAKLIQDARDTRDIREAAALLRPGSATRPYLMSLMFFGTDRVDASAVNFMIVPGDAGPVALSPMPAGGGVNYFLGVNVTVGARWVTKYHRDNVHLWQPRKATASKRRPR